MEERIEHLLELLATQKSADINKSLEHFALITNSLFSITQSLYDGKEKIKYHQRELEGKFFRYGLANQSIINLVRGNRFKLISIEVLYGDVFSIKSIVRMQIESFLIMFYLFFDKVSDEEKDLRYSVYKLHGLRKQSSFPVKSKFAEKQFKKINQEINEAEEQIKSTSIYKLGSKNEKRNLLHPKYPKLIKGKVLFQNSGLEKSRIADMWQIYSNYAHAEHISDRQYNTLYKIEKSIKNDCLNILELNSILTSKLTLMLSESFQSSKEKFETLSVKEKVHLETWGKLHESGQK
jgi:hypothetical protein